MPNMSDQTFRQLDALNNWLSDVYSKETNVRTLLFEADFKESEIEQIKLAHLSEFLQAVLHLLDTYPDLTSSWCETRK